METWTTTQGSSDGFTVQLMGEDDNPYAGYSGTEEIVAVVSPGSGQAAIPGVAVGSWLSGPDGTITVGLEGSATQGLEPATYLLELWILGTLVYQVNLEVDESAGGGTARVAKVTVKQLKKFAPWLDKLLPKLEDPTALEARADAWDWFQGLLHRHYRGSCGFSDYTFGYGSVFGSQLVEIYRDGRRSKELQDWLDAGGLDMTPEVINAMCAHAIAQICDSQVQPGKSDNDYAAFAAKYATKADVLASLITAEVDINGDGVNDITIRLGVCDTLEG